MRLCDPALDESMAGLNARLSRVEELLAGGVKPNMVRLSIGMMLMGVYL